MLSIKVNLVFDVTFCSIFVWQTDYFLDCSNYALPTRCWFFERL